MIVKRISISLVLAAMLASPFAASAQDIMDYMILRTDRVSAVYAIGDTVRVIADVVAVPPHTVNMNVFTGGYRENSIKEGPLDVRVGENILYEGVFDSPSEVMVSLTAEGSDEYMCGFLVAPEKFNPGFKAPKDLLRFWRREIREMRDLPMVSKVVPIEGDKERGEGFETFDVEVNCVGPKPVRGYMVHPKGAKPHSLPIVIFLHAAGSTPGTQAHVSTATDFAAYGALAIDINAHGFLNGQPDQYYYDLYAGELLDYSKREPKSREDYYFKWMFLRAQRALDFMVTNPLWDGKHIVVVGTSQGGAQSAFLAGIDRRVTTAVLTVPAMIDQGAYLDGRYPSWPKAATKYPDKADICRYFDPALLLGRTRASIWCEVGLYDLTCPPANVYAGINQARGFKMVIPTQRGHTMKRKNQKKNHQPVLMNQIDFTRAELKK